MPLSISNGTTKGKMSARLIHVTNDDMQKQIILWIQKQSIKIKQAHSIKLKAE